MGKFLNPHNLGEDKKRNPIKSPYGKGRPPKKVKNGKEGIPKKNPPDLNKKGRKKRREPRRTNQGTGPRPNRSQPGPKIKKELTQELRTQGINK